MNKLWRIGNHLSKMGWVPRKISRILELINHLICACSVSIDAEIGNRTIFYHRMIGAGAVILGNITIGDDSIIGANAVVTHSIPKNSLAVGVPAIIKKL